MNFFSNLFLEKKKGEKILRERERERERERGGGLGPCIEFHKGQV